MPSSSWLLSSAQAAAPVSPDDLHPISMDAGRGSSTNIFSIPALLFPPPPLPSSSYSLSSSASSRHAPPSITSFPILVLTVVGVLTTSVLLLAYYVFVIRCCLNWHRQATSDDPNLAARRRRASSSSGTGGTNTVVSGEPRGLEEAVIRALPAFRYRKAVIKTAAADDPASECAVCLAEFDEEERVRMLPACLHVFHVDCIDTWLHANANCPLCRTAITTGNSLVPPLDQLPRHDEVAIQVVFPVTDQDEQEATQSRQQQTSTAMTSAGVTDEQVSSDKQRMSRDATWHGIDISSIQADVESKDRDVLLLPLRRSFSMGSMPATEVHLHIHNILQRNAHFQFHGDDGDSSSSSTSV